MAKDNELTIKIKADSKKATTALDKIAERNRKLKESFNALSKRAAIGFAAITGGVAVSLNAYRDQEKAVNSLNAALKNQGLFTKDLSEQYQNFASEIQKVTTFGDEQIIQGQALLQSYIGQNRITKELTAAVVDFAAATGTDLNTAFGLVGKTIGSSTNALARYGVEVDASASPSEKLGAITDALGKKFQGAAAAQAEGLGSLTQLKNAFGDLLEVIGEQFAPVVTLVAIKLKEFIESIQENEELVKWGAIIATIGAALTAAIAALGLIVPAIATGVTALGSLAAAAGLAWAAITGPIGLVTAGVVALGVAAAALLGDFELSFNGILEAVKGAWDGLKSIFGKIVDGLKSIVTFGLSDLGKLWTKVFGDIEKDTKKSTRDINKTIEDADFERNKDAELSADKFAQTQKDKYDEIKASFKAGNIEIQNEADANNENLIAKNEDTQDRIRDDIKEKTTESKVAVKVNFEDITALVGAQNLKLRQDINETYDFILMKVSDVSSQIARNTISDFGEVTSTLKLMAQNVRDVITAVFEDTYFTVKSIWIDVKAATTEGFGDFETFITEFTKTIKNTLAEAVEGFGDTFQTEIAKVPENLAAEGGPIQKAIGSISPFFDAAVSKAEALADAFQKLFGTSTVSATSLRINESLNMASRTLGTRISTTFSPDKIVNAFLDDQMTRLDNYFDSLTAGMEAWERVAYAQEDKFDLEGKRQEIRDMVSNLRGLSFEELYNRISFEGLGFPSLMDLQNAIQLAQEGFSFPGFTAPTMAGAQTPGPVPGTVVSGIPGGQFVIGQGGELVLTINFADNAFDIIEAGISERQNLNISRLTT